MKHWSIAATALLALQGCTTMPPQAEGIVSVSPSVETRPVDVIGDAADDPAIWVNAADGAASLVVGTQKQGGLRVYDLDGRLLHSEPAGRTNNVDLVDGFPMPDGSTIILVGASNRTFNGVSVYRLDPADGRLHDVAAAKESTDLDVIYGFCMGRQPSSGDTFLYANAMDGTTYQFRATGQADGTVALERVRVLKLPGKVEGCTVDAKAGYLFVGEEEAALWRFDAWPGGSEEPTRLIDVGEHGIAADIEGVDVVFGPGDGYLVLSSQGNNSFAVLDRLPPHAYRGSFRIDDSRRIDGAEETDGLAVTAQPLGAFEDGLLVVQDGRNTRPRTNQNFKYVAWGDVVRALGLD